MQHTNISCFHDFVRSDQITFSITGKFYRRNETWITWQTYRELTNDNFIKVYEQKTHDSIYTFPCALPGFFILNSTITTTNGTRLWQERKPFNCWDRLETTDVHVYCTPLIKLGGQVDCRAMQNHFSELHSNLIKFQWQQNDDPARSGIPRGTSNVVSFRNSQFSNEEVKVTISNPVTAVTKKYNVEVIDEKKVAYQINMRMNISLDLFNFTSVVQTIELDKLLQLEIQEDILDAADLEELKAVVHIPMLVEQSDHHKSAEDVQVIIFFVGDHAIKQSRGKEIENLIKNVRNMRVIGGVDVLSVEQVIIDDIENNWSTITIILVIMFIGVAVYFIVSKSHSWFSGYSLGKFG